MVQHVPPLAEGICRDYERIKDRLHPAQREIIEFRHRHLNSSVTSFQVIWRIKRPCELMDLNEFVVTIRHMLILHRSSTNLMLLHRFTTPQIILDKTIARALLYSVPRRCSPWTHPRPWGRQTSSRILLKLTSFKDVDDRHIKNAASWKRQFNCCVLWYRNASGIHIFVVGNVAWKVFEEWH